MGTAFQRGATPTIQFKVPDASVLATLGTPEIAIVQEYAALIFGSDRITVNQAQGTVSVKLTEEESLQLVEEIPTQAQQVWHDETTGEVTRFPVHNLTITRSLLEGTLPVPAEEEPEEEPEEEVTG